MIHPPLSPALREGLERARWPGRCQVVRDPKKGVREGVKWWLDGAHTVESLEECGKWFWGQVGGEGAAKMKLKGEEIDGPER